MRAGQLEASGIGCLFHGLLQSRSTWDRIGPAERNGGNQSENKGSHTRFIGFLSGKLSIGAGSTELENSQDMQYIVVEIFLRTIYSVFSCPPRESTLA